MSHDEYTKLFKYMESFRGDVNKRFDKVEGDIRNIKLDVAELSARVEDYRAEVLAISHNDTRQNRWIRELAKHTGAKLSPA